MDTFKIGDKVEVLDEAIRGHVIGFAQNSVKIETEDGFEMEYGPSQLVKILGTLNVTNYDVARVKHEKDTPKKKREKVIKIKERNAPKMEVDLHIHQLTNSTRGMNNFDMLNLQIATAKRQLEFAIKKRIQKVVFIHGVGEGVLKEELKYLFNRYDNVMFYDAEYKKYGLGATEVYIYQNSN
ncbi:Smr/MutS family protein [uncultured Croceitalea sp.]|uniref:Smr/MutS family protein n=1 Tax=uncultured Croceitalea sp. TaxID=1798908 RepID=UPI00374E7F5A